MAESKAVERSSEVALARPIVAITREDFQHAQSSTLAVIRQRLTEQRAMAADLRENVDMAVKSKWRASGLKRALSQTERSVTYYEKAEQALVDGYVLMPDLPCDVFAVRTARQSISRTESRVGYQPPDPSVSAQAGLPIGAGDYVSDQPLVDHWSEVTKNAKGEERTRYTAFAMEHQAPEAPAILARPLLLSALQEAVAKRLFDEIGIVGATRSQRRADPMLVGRLVHPRGTRLNFFIAWWLDPRTL